MKAKKIGSGSGSGSSAGEKKRPKSGPKPGSVRVKMLMSNPPIRVTLTYRNGAWVETSRVKMPKTTNKTKKLNTMKKK
jgi:hypothetical protein|tara:strand:+ start:269 stop:502 length:234 start_codon:yes stop_codon:yes gene_type:complete